MRHVRPMLLLAAATAAPLHAAPPQPDHMAPPLARIDPAPDTETIRISADLAARMTVPVRIGTAGPFRFLIDTGAQNTVVSSDLAGRLALPADRAARLIGVAGEHPVQTVLVDELGLGRRSYFGLIAPVLEQSNIGADGIVGVDSLQDQRVVIDFRANTIAVSDARTLGGNAGYEIIVTARGRSGQLIVTDATIDGVRTAVVIDTGAETTIGNPALLAALGRKKARLEQTALDSVTGQSVPAGLAVARQLKLQGATLGNVTIAFADAPPFAFLGLARKPAILLGMRELRVFRRVAIDFATRRILLDLPEPGGPGYVRPAFVG